MDDADQDAAKGRQESVSTFINGLLNDDGID